MGWTTIDDFSAAGPDTGVWNVTTDADSTVANTSGKLRITASNGNAIDSHVIASTGRGTYWRYEVEVNRSITGGTSPLQMLAVYNSVAATNDGKKIYVDANAGVVRARAFVNNADQSATTSGALTIANVTALAVERHGTRFIYQYKYNGAWVTLKDETDAVNFIETAAYAQLRGVWTAGLAADYMEFDNIKYQSWSSITAWYADPTNGVDATATGSIANPYKTFNGTVTYAGGDEFRIAKTTPTTYAGGLDFLNNSATVSRNAGNATDLTTIFAVDDIINISGQTWGTNRGTAYYGIVAVTATTLTLNFKYVTPTITNQTVVLNRPHALGTAAFFNLTTNARSITISGGWDLSTGTQGTEWSWILSSDTANYQMIGFNTVSTNTCTVAISQLGFLQSNALALQVQIYGIYGVTITNCMFGNLQGGGAYSGPTIQAPGGTLAINTSAFIRADIYALDVVMSNSAWLGAFNPSNVNCYYGRNATFTNCLSASNNISGIKLLGYKTGRALFYGCEFKATHATWDAVAYNNSSYLNIPQLVINNCSFKSMADVDITAGPIVALHDASGYPYYVNYRGDSYITYTQNSIISAKIRRNTTIYRTVGLPSIEVELLALYRRTWIVLPYETRIKFAVTGGVTYTVSAYIRKNSSYGSVNRPKLVVYYDTTLGNFYTETISADATDTWSLVTVTISPTIDGVAEIDFLSYYSNSGARAYLADWSVA